MEGVYFAVWAPHAKSVSVIGDFNGWDVAACPMERNEPLGIYTVFVPGVQLGALYKFSIETQRGDRLDKADPFANSAELRPANASKVVDISNLKWTDQAWMEKRKSWDHHTQPMSIYEAHIGSWKRHPGTGKEGFYTYREFAQEVVKYMKDMGLSLIHI